MTNLETPPELAEHIADMLGVYGIGEGDPHDKCDIHKCRVCFLPRMTRRIRRAVMNEKFLESYDEFENS